MRTKLLPAVVCVAAALLVADARQASATPRQAIGGSNFGVSPAAGGRRALGAGSAMMGRPAVSPYLNILRNDGLGPLNYQTMVRPQIDARNAYLRQGAEINRLESQIRNRRRPDDQFQGIRETGHGTSFFNYSHFFANPGGSN